MEEKLDKIELAAKLGVSRATIDRWRANGMPYQKIGGRLVRFVPSEVEKWIENNQQK